MLMQEAFEYAPSAIFTLEASTTQSRDKYAHFGFKVSPRSLKKYNLNIPKVVKPATIGEGLVDSRGCFVADPALRKGFLIYPMIKVEYMGCL